VAVEMEKERVDCLVISAQDVQRQTAAAGRDIVLLWAGGCVFD